MKETTQNKTKHAWKASKFSLKCTHSDWGVMLKCKLSIQHPFCLGCWMEKMDTNYSVLHRWPQSSLGCPDFTLCKKRSICHDHSQTLMRINNLTQWTSQVCKKHQDVLWHFHHSGRVLFPSCLYRLTWANYIKLLFFHLFNHYSIFFLW